jgi:hypothetical protein
MESLPALLNSIDSRAILETSIEAKQETGSVEKWRRLLCRAPEYLRSGAGFEVYEKTHSEMDFSHLPEVLCAHLETHGAPRNDDGGGLP